MVHTGSQIELTTGLRRVVQDAHQQLEKELDCRGESSVGFGSSHDGYMGDMLVGARCEHDWLVCCSTPGRVDRELGVDGGGIVQVRVLTMDRSEKSVHCGEGGMIEGVARSQDNMICNHM